MKQVVLLGLVTVMIACNSSEGEGNIELNNTTPAIQPIGTVQAVDSNKATTATPATNTTAALNPAHGMPGHRCDIAVGAPLNSPANASAPVQMNTAPQQSAPAMQMAPANTGKILINPPHGQPGHDCAVEVGKPLPVRQ